MIEASLPDLPERGSAGSPKVATPWPRCLGRTLCGPPAAATDAVRRLCAAIKARAPGDPVPVRADEHRRQSYPRPRRAGLVRPTRRRRAAARSAAAAWRQRGRRGVPAKPDRAGRRLPWNGVAVGPDGLIDAPAPSAYEVHASPIRSAIFDAGSTRPRRRRAFRRGASRDRRRDLVGMEGPDAGHLRRGAVGRRRGMSRMAPRGGGNYRTAARRARLEARGRRRREERAWAKPPRRGRPGRRGRGGGGAARRAERTAVRVEAAPFIRRRIPNYEILDEEGLALIEANAETVLEEIGVRFSDNPRGAGALEGRRRRRARRPGAPAEGAGALALRHRAAGVRAAGAQPGARRDDRRQGPGAGAGLRAAVRARHGERAALCDDRGLPQLREARLFVEVAAPFGRHGLRADRRRGEQAASRHAAGAHDALATSRSWGR